MVHSRSTMAAKRSSVPTAISSANESNSTRLWRPLNSGLTRRSTRARCTRSRWPSSTSKGHSKRLEQRQQALARVEEELEGAQHQQAKLAHQASALGAPRQRAERDFRKQTIMTCRTLLLENALRAFMAVLLGHLQSKVSVGCVLHILFERSGACMETSSEIIYWVNTAGLSVPYRRLLKEVVDGLCAMDLREQGKPIRVCLKDMPP